MYGLAAVTQSPVDFRAGHMSVTRGPGSLPGRLPGRLPLVAHPPTSVVAFVANPEADVTSPEMDMAVQKREKPEKVESTGSGNVLPVSPARQAMEAEVQRILEQEKAMYMCSGATLENYEAVASKEHLKSLVESSYGATLVMFGSPGCRSCRSIERKVRSLAEQNPEVLFAKVNTAEEGMAAVAEGLGVPSVPYFLLFSKKTEGPNEEKELVSSFTCNLKSIDVLRAEISSVKECIETGPDGGA